MLFAISTGNSISFSSYLLHAATRGSQEGTWKNQGIAIAAITGEFMPPIAQICADSNSQP